MSYPSLIITFLGTGTSTGIPMIGCSCRVCTSTDEKDKRLRSSILVQSETTTFVVDTTPDFRQQMLRINNKKLDAVLFTHPHKDHIAGLDDVRAYNFFFLFLINAIRVCNICKISKAKSIYRHFIMPNYYWYYFNVTNKKGSFINGYKVDLGYARITFV